MTDIIMHGCNGMMGRTISRIAADYDDLKIVAGVDPKKNKLDTYPVFASLYDIDINADVIIDFSSASAVDGLLDYCEGKKIPLVLATTGLSKDQLERVDKVSKKTAILRAANMSLGINVLLKTLKSLAPIFAKAGFDIEIIEKHHNKKLDAPSGTALALADAVKEGLCEDYHYIYDRSALKQKRDAKEIGISAVRGGTIPGEHQVLFCGQDEIIELKHTAYSKAIFAKGALEAAAFLKGKPAGLYDMQDVIAL